MTPSQELQLTRCLHQIDPILQFLTRATGHDRIPLPMIYKAIPKSIWDDASSTTTSTTTTTTAASSDNDHPILVIQDSVDNMNEKIFLQNLQVLCTFGILALHCSPRNADAYNRYDTAVASDTPSIVRWDDTTVSLGFPLPSTTHKLHGSTKVAAKRRAAALKKKLKELHQQQHNSMEGNDVLIPTVNDALCQYDRTSDANEVADPHVTEDPTLNCLHDCNKNIEDVSLPTSKCSINDEVKIQPSDISKSHGCDVNVEREESNYNEMPIEHKIPDDAYAALCRLLGFAEEGRTNTICENDKDEVCDDPDRKRPSIRSRSKTNNTIFATSAIDNATMSGIIPRQASYAGSTEAQESDYAALSDRIVKQIPISLLLALQVNVSASCTSTQIKSRRLYSHQVAAIEATMDNIHCSVCTGTGSGKSLCYLIPALTAAYNDNHTSLLLFPTKALAQDQLSKLLAIVAKDPELQQRIRPATLDGDTSHAARSRISDCNIILTNPDILHASILPSWRTKTYQQMLSSLRYVAIDEAHIYDGVFGAHVAMILRRLVRLASIARATTTCPNIPIATIQKCPTFIATSATLHNPMEHFRLLCPMDQHTPIKIISSIEDGSPRSAKHFFLWNPPVLQLDGTSTGKLYFPTPTSSKLPPTEATTDLSLHDGAIPTGTATQNTIDCSKTNSRKRRRGSDSVVKEEVTIEVQSWTVKSRTGEYSFINEYRRRHAAEETARLLARAVAHGIRCIAFCKTRNLVEWVYTKTIDALKHDPATKSLVSKVESYRGGYTVTERRKIEEKLFNNNILGVVGTNALELGVDIGGIDLTLHCGYPSSYTSLLQQAGRSGRGKDRLGIPSVAVVICFSSPSEQQLWRRPKSLLSKGPSSSISIPFQEDLVQGHLLCASEEFPLMGSTSIANITGLLVDDQRMSDSDLFGTTYDDALNFLISSGAVTEEIIPCLLNPTTTQKLWKARPTLRKAWSRLSIRSIEPIQYSIVDLSHTSQRGRSDGIHDMTAVLDTIPYSRVFYHAHPGAIITHRGKKYEIVAMTPPPEFVKENFGCMRSQQLAAYVRPTTATYLTRPLADTIVTIVKQFENVEICESAENEILKSQSRSTVNFAGCGAVSVKRQVRGYKKLSLVNFSEIARTELTLPPIEFDTFGLYICTDSNSLSASLGERYGPGVHALSHALLAVAPLFAMGLTRGDIECCHEFYSPNKIIIFDERAGGSGCVQRIWQSFFQPNGILESAVDLLRNCSSCSSDSRYDGGCPACLHASQCSKFNTHLSRSAAIVIGERMVGRIKETSLYKNSSRIVNYTDEPDAVSSTNPILDTTPRRKARQMAMKKAKEMHSSRNRQFVVSRPSWPLDGQNKRLEHG